MQPDTTEDIGSNLDPIMGDVLGGLGDFAKITSATQGVAIGTLDIPAAWTGSKRRQLSVVLRFVGETNPKTEVYNPIQQLLYWACGTRLDGLGGYGEEISVIGDISEHLPAGTSLAQKRPNVLGYRIGQSFGQPLIESVRGGAMIVQCQPNWEAGGATYDENGYPYYAEVTLVLEDLYVPFKRSTSYKGPYRKPGTIRESPHVNKYDR